MEEKEKKTSKAASPRLTREEIQLLKETFQVFDTDRDGKITYLELGKAMRTLGHHPTQEELRVCFLTDIRAVKK